MAAFDLLVVGGGIVGCSAAAHAARRGASVIVVEADRVAAGASGRNSGSVQYPFDPALSGLHTLSLEAYRDVADSVHGWDFPHRAAGLLLLTDDPVSMLNRANELSLEAPQLEPREVSPDDLRLLEPALAHGTRGVLLDTGFPIDPGAATVAMAAHARGLGAEVRQGTPVDALIVRKGRAEGATMSDGTRIVAHSTLIAAGIGSPHLAKSVGHPLQLAPTYGVTVQVRLPLQLTRVLEEDGVDAINRPALGPGSAGGPVRSIFSLVPTAGAYALGSTFLPTPQDPARVAPQLLQRARKFVPSIGSAAVAEARICARPQSLDGRPYVGQLKGAEGLFACTGHGPWGMSIGPGSAAMVVACILDAEPVPLELAAARAIDMAEPITGTPA